MSDSLVATRARRLNAGSRLKKLIELEEQSVEERQNIIYTEDDENVNLLFQEDENDEEFEVSEDEVDVGDDEEEEGEGEGEEGEEGEGSDDLETGSLKRKLDDTDINADDVLSDSDLSETDSDESEGEKELNKQEQLKKKKNRKKQSLIPVIKTPINKAKKPKIIIKKSEFTAESLLNAKRSSSRSAVVESKHALAQKLKANEERRAALKPIVRIKQVEMTQEEKLLEAIETEKANVIALNQFREQEIVKKESQRQMLLLRRVKLTNVIRLVSEEYFVTPFDEISTARRQYEKENQKSKRKPGRKKKTLENNVEQTVKRRNVWEIDQELPLVKIEMEQKRIEEEKEKERIVKEEEEERKTKGRLEENDSVIQAQESGIEEKNNEDDMEIDEDKNENTVALENNEESKIEEKEEEVEEVVIEDKDETKDEIKEKLNEDEESKVEKVEKSEMNEEESSKGEDDIKKEPEEFTEKKVKFADEVDETPAPEDTPTPETPTPETPKGDQEVFEGPAQRISRNMIYLLDFDEEKDHKLDESNIKTLLFGKQSLLPASRRFKDLKQIVKIGEVDNPYLTVVHKKDELFEPVTDLTEEDMIFEELKRLPRFGEYEDIVEEEEVNNEEVTSEIILKTEAPTSLYLSNGNKKECLITGTEVKYFDPSNGIPYSNVETYRLLKQIEQGNVPWYSFSSDANDGGAGEMYLGMREGARHAKGVPEGFDI